MPCWAGLGLQPPATAARGAEAAMPAGAAAPCHPHNGSACPNSRAPLPAKSACARRTTAPTRTSPSCWKTWGYDRCHGSSRARPRYCQLAPPSRLCATPMSPVGGARTTVGCRGSTHDGRPSGERSASVGPRRRRAGPAPGPAKGAGGWELCGPPAQQQAPPKAAEHLACLGCSLSRKTGTRRLRPRPPKGRGPQLRARSGSVGRGTAASGATYPGTAVAVHVLGPEPGHGRCFIHRACGPGGPAVDGPPLPTPPTHKHPNRQSAVAAHRNWTVHPSLLHR